MTRSVLLLTIFIATINQATATNSQVLRLHGSKTVGASLVPALLDAWLKQKGYTIISKEQTAAEELSIMAENAHSEIIRVELHSHGSSTSFRD